MKDYYIKINDSETTYSNVSFDASTFSKLLDQI